MFVRYLFIFVAIALASSSKPEKTKHVKEESSASTSKPRKREKAHSPESVSARVSTPLTMDRAKSRLDLIRRSIELESARTGVVMDRSTNQLSLYGLYKQATQGDCTQSYLSLGLTDFEGAFKIKSWSDRRGMTPGECVDAYIVICKQTYPDWVVPV